MFYLAVRALLGGLVGSRRGLDVKNVELAVLAASPRSLRWQLVRVAFANSGGLVFMDESAEEIPTL